LNLILDYLCSNSNTTIARTNKNVDTATSIDVANTNLVGKHYTTNEEEDYCTCSNGVRLWELDYSGNNSEGGDDSNSIGSYELVVAAFDKDPANSNFDILLNLEDILFVGYYLHTEANYLGEQTANFYGNYGKPIVAGYSSLG